MTTSDFQEIPILDVSKATTDKGAFLAELQHALVHVGFFYVVNHGVPQSLVDATVRSTESFFDLPIEEKLKADKVHSPTFLGYSVQGNEITKDKKDNREQLDFANELPAFWEEGQPLYQRLTGPNLWPSSAVLPGFKDTILSYHSAVTELGDNLTRLVAESLGLPPDTLLDRYVEPNQQHRAKLIKYPAVDELTPADGDQGVGAHRDTASILTILLQANLPGLQVQNHSGKWIDAPVIPGSFVVNIGTGLEYLVDNVAVATTHRVLNPPAGAGPRYSIAYFTMARLDRKHTPVALPPEILAQRPKDVVTDTTGFQFAQLYSENPGKYALLNRMSSHRDVAARWYSELAKENGIDVTLGNAGY